MMDGIAETLEEVDGKRADYVKPNAKHQLDLGDGGRPIAHSIIEPGEFPLGKPATVRAAERRQQNCQYQPADEGMRC